MKKSYCEIFSTWFQTPKKYENCINSVIFAGPQNLLKTEKKKLQETDRKDLIQFLGKNSFTHFHTTKRKNHVTKKWSPECNFSSNMFSLMETNSNINLLPAELFSLKSQTRERKQFRWEIGSWMDDHLSLWAPIDSR